MIAASYKDGQAIIFDGDNYTEEWHDEAEQARPARTSAPPPTPCRPLISEDTVAVFSNYGVLDERELHARYEVMLEQYVVTVNIEAETAADIAATMILPAAVKHLADAQRGRPDRPREGDHEP